ncbi:MAG TPA: ABC transporter ATP-binding protein [Anaerolinea thermolimosa]|uniref:ABC transporter ATP-binding protein n=1 Tax=Anaerolinea thermolimosa TaxID=229919 RepID=A0A3D1JD79_9CHLR|nr:ABC transporter ATP-binding protein [Anaerolinea thermolimosa]GAP08178.1 ABC-type antimicrobial peptide transport system, ATPase component [Anaerolinea thermolimosa]HCE16539.1 ABC transporter ATP-binding protein [Anaerolinea thermolimosa]
MAEPSAFIVTRNLRKTFVMGRTRVHALAGIDLDIPEGTFTVIMGPSGSGKSTLLYLIGGLDRPTSGTLLVNGQDLNMLDENALAVYRRNTVGFVFQQFNLITSMTALENAAFPMRFAGIPGKERAQRARKLLELVGLETHLRHRPVEMSGGQQQRVAIARALINNPRLILADEPTGNLDTTTGFGIMQLLSNLHRDGRTVVVVTHDPRMLRFATHVLYLLDGRLVSREEYEASIQTEPTG